VNAGGACCLQCAVDKCGPGCCFGITCGPVAVPKVKERDVVVPPQVRERGGQYHE
jgi:hypothetical protein